MFFIFNWAFGVISKSLLYFILGTSEEVVLYQFYLCGDKYLLPEWSLNNSSLLQLALFHVMTPSCPVMRHFDNSTRVPGLRLVFEVLYLLLIAPNTRGRGGNF